MTDPEPFRPMGAGPAFSIGSKLERALWQTAWLLLARWTPPPLFGWRRLVLQLFGARVGRGVRIYASTRVWLPRNLTICEGAIVGPRVRLYNQGPIAIGAHTVVSQEASLCASTHDVSDSQFALVTRPITIGRACWVGAEAFVGPGVTMGEGSVLGARGVLFDDTEPLRIYRGNPALLVRAREFR